MGRRMGATWKDLSEASGEWKPAGRVCHTEELSSREWGASGQATRACLIRPDFQIRPGPLDRVAIQRLIFSCARLTENGLGLGTILGPELG